MRICIVGIGLIGSSLARALRLLEKLPPECLEGANLLVHKRTAPSETAAPSENSAKPEIWICDCSANHLEIAKANHLGDQYFLNVAAAVTECDFVFVCVPVDKVASVILEFAPFLKSGAIVTDVGSVKEPIIEALEGKLPANVIYIPGHPIAGTECSGPAAGFAALFDGKPYILMKPVGQEKAFSAVAALVGAIGAKVYELQAGQHDKIFAHTSHLPHLLAYAAMLSVRKADDDRELYEELAGGGFHSLTRVAASDPALWADIFLMNAAQLQVALKQFLQETEYLISLVKSGDRKCIVEALTTARRKTAHAAQTGLR